MGFFDKFKKNDEKKEPDFNFDDDPFKSQSADDPFAPEQNNLNDNSSNHSEFDNQSFEDMHLNQHEEDEFMTHTSDELTGQTKPFQETNNQFSSNNEMRNNQNNYAEPEQQAPVRTMGQQLAHDYVNSNQKINEIEKKAHDPMELINLKLDAVRNSLENIDLRLRKMELQLEKNQRRGW
ncbi:MAG: hypothetical protein AB7V77_02030 [Candidatus Woesearchaeota archaeon]